MSKKLHTLLTLVVQNLLGYKIIVMHNLMTKFQKILENSKQYAGNQVNGKRKVPQPSSIKAARSVGRILFNKSAFLSFCFGSLSR